MFIPGVVGEILDEYFRRRIAIYGLVTLMLVVGLITGAAAVRIVDAEDYAELSSFLNAYVAQVSSGPGSASLATTKSSIAVDVLRGAAIPWLLGLTVIGAPLALFFVFLRGFALGFTLMFLLEQFSIKGALLALVSVAPHNLFAIPGIVLAAGAAATFAVGAAKAMGGRRSEVSIYSQLATATILTAASASLIAFSAWIERSITPVLIDVVGRFIPFV